MWDTEISPTEEGGCGIQLSATEFWNEKLENYNFTKDGLMHFACILLTGLLLCGFHILFVLISDRNKKKKNGACHRSPEMFPQLQFYLVVPLTPQDTMGSASDIQRLCFSRKELLGNE